MASRAVATSAPLFLLILNVIFCTMVSSTNVPCPPPPPPPCPPSPQTPSPPPPHTPSPPPPQTSSPPPPKSSSPPPPHTPSPPPPQYIYSSPPPPKSSSPPPPYSPSKATCPLDTLKLGVCANLLNDLLHIVIGTPPTTPCCTLIAGLADLEAAVCLCTAIKANVLGINLNIPISLSLLLNNCGKEVPSGFQCA